MTEHTPTQYEMSFAINRAIDLHKKTEWVARLDKGTPTLIAAHWVKTLETIHSTAFQDTYGFDAAPAAQLTPTMGRQTGTNLSAIMTELVGRLYDANGYRKNPPREEVLDALAVAYRKFMELAPFPRGNGFVFRQFLSGLAKAEGLKDVLPAGIDWRRANADDAIVAALVVNPADGAAIKSALFAAADYSKTIQQPKLQPDEQWTPWPDNSVRIAGISFMATEYQGQACLVGLDGSLFPRAAVEKRLAKFLRTVQPSTGYVGHPADFVFDRAKSIDNVLHPDAAVNDVDGIEIVNGKVPLFCTEVDHLTGLLRGTQMDGFLTFIAQQHVMLKDVASQKTLLLEASPSPEMTARIQRAAERMEHILPVIRASVISKTHNHTTPDDGRVHFFMPMGGTGSGKSATRTMAETMTNGNFVTASLDESRPAFDIYELYRTYNHHSDDAIALEKAANLLRDEVQRAAINKRLNLYLDGSGIPYKNRFDATVQSMKKAGYATHIYAVEAPLYIDAERTDIMAPAYQRMRSRFKEENWAVPYSVMLDKHTGMPLSLLEAAKDSNVDEFLLFDSAYERKKGFILGQTIKGVTAAQMQALSAAKTQGGDALFNALQAYDFLPHEVNENANVPAPEKAGFLTLQRHGVGAAATYDMLVVRDEGRLMDIMQKGHLNRNASGLEALPFNNHASLFPRVDAAGANTSHVANVALRKLNDASNGIGGL